MPASTPLLVTVDVPVAGARLRDVHNGMSIPLLGVTCLEELSPKHVTQLRRLMPVEPPPR